MFARPVRFVKAVSKPGWFAAEKPFCYDPHSRNTNFPVSVFGNERTPFTKEFPDPAFERANEIRKREFGRTTKGTKWRQSPVAEEVPAAIFDKSAKILEY